jgi:acyl dehydratase
VGVGADAVDPKQLPYVYEDNLRALPTFCLVVAYPGFWMREPQYGFTWQQVLHAEESIEFHTPLPAAGAVYGETMVEDVVDRGADKGCFVYLKKDLLSADKRTRYATIRSNTLARADGGFGGKSAPHAAMPAPPTRSADMVCDLSTTHNAALIYRLCGDMNPLHADPEVATSAGFSRPILHGRCTLGVAMHALLKSCCDYDAARLQALNVRFSSPFLPGETLRTEIWREGDLAFFRSTCLERNVVVLNNGSARIAS